MGSKEVMQGFRVLLLKLILLVVVFHVSITSFLRLLVVDESGTLLVIASVPAFTSVSWLSLFGTLGVLLANGWALALFALAGWIINAFYEPDPLLASVNFVLIVTAIVATQAFHTFPHVISHIKRGSNETVSLHVARAMGVVARRLVLAALLALAVTSTVSLFSAVGLVPGASSVIAVLIIGSIGLGLIMATMSISRE